MFRAIRRFGYLLTGFLDPWTRHISYIYGFAGTADVIKSTQGHIDEAGWIARNNIADDSMSLSQQLKSNHHSSSEWRIGTRSGGKVHTLLENIGLSELCRDNGDRLALEIKHVPTLDATKS
jgi:hypothetical protein